MAKDGTVKTDYEVTKSREIAGQYRNRGDKIALTSTAAKYYLAPYGSGLKVSDAVGEKFVVADDPKAKIAAKAATLRPAKQDS